MAQKRNPQNEELLSGHFARRDEPQFSLGNTISTYMGLPVCRSFVPFSMVGTTVTSPRDAAADFYYTRYGTSSLNFENLIPYGIAVSALGCGWSPGSDLSNFKITGAITLGAWVNLSAVNTGTNQAILSKWDAALGRSYLLYESGGNLRFIISSDGGAVNVDSIVSTETISAGEWTFVVGSWNTTSITVWVNNVSRSVASAQPSIHNGTAWYFMMSDHSHAYQTQGKISMAFVCSGRTISDSVIKNLYQQSRYMFGG